jgi:hypothetical protein
MDVTFDDEAPDAVECGPPNVGNFQSLQQNLRDFRGRDAGGSWTIRVTNFSDQPGTLVAWSIEVQEGALACDCNGNDVPDAREINRPRFSFSNDECEDANPICQGSGAVEGDTTGATPSVPVTLLCDNVFGAKDVFYWYRPQWTGEAFVSIFGLNNPVLSIHDDCPCTADNLVACNEQNPFGVQWPAQKGTRYYIRIAGQNYSEGPYTIQLGNISPPCVLGENDDNVNGIPDDCECITDLNGDCMVDAADFFLILAAFGPCTGDCCEDIDGNGVVDIVDLQLWMKGPCPKGTCGTCVPKC